MQTKRRGFRLFKKPSLLFPAAAAPVPTAPVTARRVATAPAPLLAGASLSVLLIILFLTLFPETFSNSLSWIQNVFVMKFSWFYTLIVFGLLGFCFFAAFGPWGRIRLGRRPRPKYSFFTWLAMLFSAGMGTGLLFSGVWEPLHHWIYPPESGGGAGSVGGRTMEALNQSFQIVFLHWGLPGWAVYTFMGLAAARLSLQKATDRAASPETPAPETPAPLKNPPKGAPAPGAPAHLRVSVFLRPLWKGIDHSPAGFAIDLLTAVAALCGVAATLGRGALQINSGMEELFNLPFSKTAQAAVVILITFAACLSVLSGIDKSIRRLSELNILLGFFLLVFVLSLGPSTQLFSAFIQNLWLSLKTLPLAPFQSERRGDAEWRSLWTALYWAWWIAWSPFVGLFIARISEGRTVRELVLGALAAPAALSCLWFAAFGGSAVFLHLEGAADWEPLLKSESSVLIFKFLQTFPLGAAAAFVALVSVILFFITSSDSASYTLHQMASPEIGRNGKSGDSPSAASEKTLDKKAPGPDGIGGAEKSLIEKLPLQKSSAAGTASWRRASQRAARRGKISWASLEGILALSLILLGGTKSLELLVIFTAFPFAVLMIFIAAGLIKDFRKNPAGPQRIFEKEPVGLLRKIAAFLLKKKTAEL